MLDRSIDNGFCSSGLVSCVWVRRSTGCRHPRQCFSAVTQLVPHEPLHEGGQRPLPRHPTGSLANDLYCMYIFMYVCMHICMCALHRSRCRHYRHNCRLPFSVFFLFFFVPRYAAINLVLSHTSSWMNEIILRLPVCSSGWLATTLIKCSNPCLLSSMNSGLNLFE